MLRAPVAKAKKALPIAIALGGIVVLTGSTGPGDTTAKPTAALKTASASSATAGQKVGSPLLLGGRTSSWEPIPLEIRFSPRGSKAWKPLKRVRSNRNGAFRTRVKARRHGQVIARPASGRPSHPIKVRVRSATRMALSARNPEVGQKVKVRARALPGGKRPYRVVVKGPDKEVIEGVTRRNGAFTAAWKTVDTGSHRVKVHVGGNRTAFGSSSAAKRFKSFRPVGASWYGPGFYGGTTACGQTLTSSTVGVAHKTLPCGTELTLRYGGQSVRTEVIDRGPYIAGREIDLTYATKERLGFGDVGDVLIDK